MYCREADLFLAQGLRCFLLETLPTDDGAAQLARHLKNRCPDAFLIVSFAVAFDGVTREGFHGEELFRRTAAIPEADAVGFNCVSGPHHLLEYIRVLDLDVLGGKALSVMPNAGYPTMLGRTPSPLRTAPSAALGQTATCCSRATPSPPRTEMR